MAKEIEQQNEEIIGLLSKHPKGLSRGQISNNIGFFINYKTLQRRLAALVDDGKITKQGERKAARYYLHEARTKINKGQLRDETVVFRILCHFFTIVQKGMTNDNAKAEFRY